MDTSPATERGLDLTLWGKTLPTGETYPLLAHLLDTGAVVRAYLDGGWASGDLERHLARLTETSVEHLTEALALMAALHDVGKASPQFQRKVEGWRGLEADRDAGAWEPGVTGGPDPARLKYHAFVSGLAYRRAFGARDLVADVLAGHHGVFADEDIAFARATRAQAFGAGGASVLSGCERLWGDANPSNWVTQWDQLVAACRRAFGDHTPTLHTHTGLPALTQLVVLADWVASGHLIDITSRSLLDDEHQYALSQTEVARSVLTELLGRPAPDHRTTSFADLFPAIEKPSRLQLYVRDLPQEPGLTIIAAPMGAGKTEAALSRALDGRTGIYFALPTGATASVMFERVIEFVDRNLADGSMTANLLHRGSSLNAFYRDVSLRNDADPNDAEPNVSDGLTKIEANDWLRGRHKALLARIGVGTVDRILHGVLPHRYGFLKLGALSGRTVILDEVHSYDAYTTELVVRLVGWLAACGADVVVLSATLPSATATKLIDSWSSGRAASGYAVSEVATDEIGETAAYPSVCHVPGNGDPAYSETITTTPYDLELAYLDANTPAALADQACRPIDDAGPCFAAVICNTIDGAQDAATVLHNRYPDAELHVLHSRMPAGMREETTQRVAKRLGKYRPDTTDHYQILVATQVAEQSLDVDVDVMVSQLAPIASLLQRSGRLWRHNRERRAGARRLWVSRRSPPLDRWPYTETPVARTWDRALQGGARTHISIPDGVQELIDIGFDTTARQDLEERYTNDTLEGEAANRLIPSPEKISRASQLTAKFDLDIHGDLLTRIGANNLQVLLTGPGRPWAWPRALPLRPTLDEQRHLLECVAPIPIRPGSALAGIVLAISTAPPEAWKDHAPSLRGVRVLDLDHPRCPVRLDPLLGVVRVQQK